MSANSAKTGVVSRVEMGHLSGTFDVTFGDGHDWEATITMTEAPRVGALVKITVEIGGER